MNAQNRSAQERAQAILTKAKERHTKWTAHVAALVELRDRAEKDGVSLVLQDSILANACELVRQHKQVSSELEPAMDNPEALERALARLAEYEPDCGTQTDLPELV